MNFKIIAVPVLLFMIACSPNNQVVIAGTEEENTVFTKGIVEEVGYKLLKQNCYACHNLAAASHDDLLAPPMVAVKRRYKVSYNTKDAFTKALIKWAKDPKEENALMHGAVKNFKVMPKQDFDKNQLKVIADYIWDNELEKPEWFDEHFKKQHPNGMGAGQGKRNQ